MIEALCSFEVEPIHPVDLTPGTDLNAHYFRVIDQVMGVVSSEVPQIVGMTIFGSLSRNEAKVKEDGSVSDVDGVVIIDAANDSELTEIVTYWQKNYATLAMTALGMDTKVKMQELIDQTACTGSESDIDLLLVSDRQLLDIPRDLLATAKEPDSKVTDWSSVDKDIKNTLRYFIGRDKTSGLFFPKVYGDLQQYKRKAIEPIAELRRDKPQITARIWQNIRSYNDYFTKGRDVGDIVSLYLPENVDEAIQEYLAA